MRKSETVLEAKALSEEKAHRHLWEIDDLEYDQDDLPTGVALKCRECDKVVWLGDYSGGL